MKKYLASGTVTISFNDIPVWVSSGNENDLEKRVKLSIRERIHSLLGVEMYNNFTDMEVVLLDKTEIDF